MMRRPLGYIPTLRELHFVANDVTVWWRRALTQALTPIKRLAGYLNTLRTARRLATPVRPPKLVSEPILPAAQVSIAGYRRRRHRKPSALSAAVGHLTRLRSSARTSAPDRDTARRPGAHRLENLSHMANAQYAVCMHVRAQYVEHALARLTKLAANGRVFGETSWKEARRADRYAIA